MAAIKQNKGGLLGPPLLFSDAMKSTLIRRDMG